MKFIKKMKLRENIEMTIKTVMALLVCFLAIILMESMIYGIQLNALKTKGNNKYLDANTTIAYCLEEEEDKYFVLYYNEDRVKNGGSSNWSAQADTYLTKAECDSLTSQVKEVIFRAPTAFELSIDPIHYIVMGVLVAGVSGYFVYRFILLNKTYKQIEKKYNETGEIEITNF